MATAARSATTPTAKRQESSTRKDGTTVENSKISWTTHTFNPWRGCTKVSHGCTNCYADTLSKRNPHTLGIWGPNGKRVVASEAQWNQPIKWNTTAAIAGVRPRVFCSSLADVFEDWRGYMSASSGVRLGSDFRAAKGDGDYLTMDMVRMRLFSLIRNTPNMDWLLLTKRPENIKPMFDRMREDGLVSSEFFPWKNVWLGASVEDQETANIRIQYLLAAPAVVHFLSVEPLLGPVKIDRQYICPMFEKHYADGTHIATPILSAARIDWVIVGGESGPGARPFHLDWAKDIANQCDSAGVPFFMKQAGSNPWDWNKGNPNNYEPDEEVPLKLKSKKGETMAEWPSELQRQEFPKGCLS